MVTARCFWALIKFMTAYLLAFVIAYLLALGMLAVSCICPCRVPSKIFSYAFPFSLLVICFSFARVLLLSWLLATHTSLKDLVEGFDKLVGSSYSTWALFWFVARFLAPFYLFIFLILFLFFIFITYILLGILSVTCIRQGGILLICHFLLWLTPI